MDFLLRLHNDCKSWLKIEYWIHFLFGVGLTCDVEGDYYIEIMYLPAAVCMRRSGYSIIVLCVSLSVCHTLIFTGKRY